MALKSNADPKNKMVFLTIMYFEKMFKNFLMLMAVRRTRANTTCSRAY